MRVQVFAAGAVVLLLAGVCLAEVEHNDTIQRSFAVAGSDRKLVIDNIFGGIRVTGGVGTEIRATVQERWRADSAERLAEGRRDVRLDIRQEGNVVTFYVDGPFRCQHRDCGHSRGDQGYKVRYDFDVTVPQDIALSLKTVNSGSIIAKNTRGAFEIRNVNGGIELTDVAGAGTANTVNGRVQMSFTENPREAVSAKTVNGEIEASFQPSLSADFRFKTFNGEAFTDFNVTNLPTSVAALEREGGRKIYKSNRFTGIRVAAGGPEHKFETLNGDIRILKRGN